MFVRGNPKLITTAFPYRPGKAFRVNSLNEKQNRRSGAEGCVDLIINKTTTLKA